jgi:hypothetical protein
MSYLKNSLFLFSVFLIAVGIIFILGWLYTAEFASYADMQMALSTTTATFGTLLGIITAGVMFTHGRFSELSSELGEKSPDYLANLFSLEKVQSIETHLLTLRRTFTQLASTTTVTEEKNLYERIVGNVSTIFVNFAVLLNFKFKQQGLPDSGLLVSEMDSSLYKDYEKKRKSVKREWQLFNVIRNMMDAWEASGSFLNGESNRGSRLEADLKSSIHVLRLKETIDKSSTIARSEVTKTLSYLSDEMSKIRKRLREDRILQLLPQMEQANTLRGKYFYLMIIFITAPLLINLLILPQLTAATATFFKPIVSITNALSVMGVIFLLLYMQKILNV